MAIVTEFRPQGWSFDINSGPERDWVPKIAQAGQLDLAKSKAQFYDFHTIFYQVSYCVERGGFYAIGPKFLNLESLIMPMKARVSVDGGVSYTDLQCDLLPTAWYLRNDIVLMPAPDLPSGTVFLQLELVNGDTEAFQIEIGTPKSKPISINTLQKDNPVAWIMDWVLYYRSYGVFDFHIYDNGSENVAEVIDALETDIPQDTRIQITHWPYRYGIVEFPESHWCQVGSINDFLFQSQSVDWVINCDIDEYIILDSAFTTLPEFLDSMDQDVACAQFGCSNAPLFSAINYPDPVSARDLAFRTREIFAKYKNAFRPAKTIVAGVHHVHLKAGYKNSDLPIEHRFYLHAHPLNTGWVYPRRLKKTTPVPFRQKYVRDTRVIERLRAIDRESSNN